MTVQFDPLVLDILPAARDQIDEAGVRKSRDSKQAPVCPPAERESPVAEAPAGVWGY